MPNIRWLNVKVHRFEVFQQFGGQLSVFRICTVSDPCNVYSHFLLYLSVVSAHDDYTICQIDGLIYAVSDEYYGLFVLLPYAEQLFLQYDACIRVQCSERFVHEQHVRVVGKSPPAMATLCCMPPDSS